MANLYKKEGELVFDNLVSDVKPAVLVSAGTIEKLSEEATIKRGTILAKKSNGKLIILGSDYDATKTFSATGDGSKTVYSLVAAGIMPVAVLEVKVDGTATTDYVFNPVLGEITFNTAPANTKAIAVKFAVGGGKAYCILCDDVVVGTSNDEKGIVYTGGCFNLSKCIVATGYTMTDQDKDDLRKLNIIFKSMEV